MKILLLKTIIADIALTGMFYILISGFQFNLNASDLLIAAFLFITLLVGIFKFANCLQAFIKAQQRKAASEERRADIEDRRLSLEIEKLNLLKKIIEKRSAD